MDTKKLLNNSPPKSKMAVIKTSLILLVVACALIANTEAINNWVRVPPCDQVCSRSSAEKDSCCQAHGHAFHANCNGGMNCYRR
ncbi:psychimicin-like isoform X2 [Leguminivora glycinivorella]|uniref:psychimicin-like isoform X2 n=1 Tax=Leguminivora glycinivorella TaxID=1035111 RepID=UPI00200C5DD5|nr:psychimicin-like isoform X2 [Leguminivora glycinivorella]